MSSNKLYGSIHSSHGKLLHLDQKLALASYNLLGPIPMSFFEMPTVVYLDLRSNQLNDLILDYLT